MFNPEIFTRLLLAFRQQQQQYQEDVERYSQMPISRYLMEAFSSNPRLLDGDIFAHRDYVQRNVPRLMSEEEERNADLPKCNARAAKARQEGNKLYQKNDFQEALTKYNESICWAENGSEDLAIGYANRSAVYYENKEYEFALGNIALAKKHNYPERLMPKLLARELNCKSKIEAGETISSKPCPKLAPNVEVNPKIPFLAKGIAMKVLPRYGRSMVAERAFKAGNVILCEKPMLANISPAVKYAVCQYCASVHFMSLIPCPQCVSVMYCNEECLKKGWKAGHRFECGIYDKVGSVPFDECHMGPKLFFYGLSLFNDDVKKMMKYCKSHTRTGSNPFDLDYTNEDPLAEFKVFHTAKIMPREPLMENVHRCVAAIFYTMFMQQPLVQSLIVNKAQQNFMLKYIFDYSTLVNRLSVIREEDCIDLLHTVASVCNHSCDPNTHAIYRSGQLKFVVVRPISKGEQICISYGPIYGETATLDRLQQLSSMEMDCACEVCHPNSFQRWKNRSECHPPVFHHHLEVMQKLLVNETLSNADKLNALQQFIQRYGYVHPLDLFRKILTLYREGLSTVFGNELSRSMRQQMFDSLN